MSRTYKRETFEHGQYTLLSGSEKHEVELVPGDLDLWVEWYANRDVIVWLQFQDGLRVPYRNGLSGSFNVRVRDILSVVLEATKLTTICVAVQYKELAVKDKLDYTPVVIDPPRSAQLDLSALMSREVAQQLQRLGYVKQGEPLEVDEEDDLEDEEDDEGFGPGHMEEEEPVALPRRKRGPAVADNPPSSGGNPAPGNSNPASGGEPSPSS